MKVAIVIVAIVAAVGAYPHQEVEGFKEKAACVRDVTKDTIAQIEALAQGVVDALKDHVDELKELESLKKLIERVQKLQADLKDLLAERKFGEIISRVISESSALSKILSDVIEAVSKSTDAKLHEIADKARSDAIALGVQTVAQLMECMSK